MKRLRPPRRFRNIALRRALVYLAGPFGWRDRIRGYAEELKSCGMQITSRWLDETCPADVDTDDLDPKYVRRTALMDLEDIKRSRVFVLFTPTDEELTNGDVSLRGWSRGGRNFETGFAYSQRRQPRLIVCGPRESVFHSLDDFTQFDTWTSTFQCLKSLIVYRTRLWPQRFWDEVNKTEGGCWLWQGATMVSGYGNVHVPGDSNAKLAHRVAWMLVNGEIPRGIMVCHRCDTPACVNPDHLFLGTQKENIVDMVRKDRSGRKLNWEQVDAIRIAEAAGEQAALIAERFGISKGHVQQIWSNRIWKKEYHCEIDEPVLECIGKE